MRSNATRDVLAKWIVATIAVTLFAAAAAAQDRSASLQLKRAKHLQDENGRIWLVVQFVNQGSHPVRILGVAPARSGPWTDGPATLAPGAMARERMSVAAGEPSTIWVDTSEGLAVFVLPAR